MKLKLSLRPADDDFVLKSSASRGGVLLFPRVCTSVRPLAYKIAYGIPCSLRACKAVVDKRSGSTST